MPSICSSEISKEVSSVITAAQSSRLESTSFKFRWGGFVSMTSPESIRATVQLEPSQPLAAYSSHKQLLAKETSVKVKGAISAF